MSIADKMIRAIAIVVLLPSLLVAEENAVRHTPSNEREFWEHYLASTGKSLGCHFTIEILVRELDDPKSSSRFFVDDDKEVKTVDEVIDKASKKTEGLIFVKNKNNPQIVHVIDDDLRKIPGYAIDQKMDLKYSGFLDEISKAIETKFPALGPRRSGDLAKFLIADPVTEIEIDAKDQVVRDILTDCVPLKGYSPLLWRAETERAEGKGKTIVQYYGPMRK